MSNSEVSETTIDWASAASTPLSSWADEMDEIDAMEPSSPPRSIDDSQPESPRLGSSSSSSEGEDDSRSSTTDMDDRIPRSESNNSLNRSYNRTRKDLSSDVSGSRQVSVKEEIPFPEVAPFVAFITNLHTDATKEDISKSFEQTAGVPKSIKIILNKESGLPRGFCYVEFEDASSLKTAIEADGMELLGQTLHIVVAAQKKTPNPSMRNSFSSSRDHTRKNSNKPRQDHHDSKPRQPRMDSASLSSNGKSDGANSSFGRRGKEDRFNSQRSSSFSGKSKQDTSSKWESSPLRGSQSKLSITTRFNGVRKVEEKSTSNGNMFSALQAFDGM